MVSSDDLVTGLISGVQSYMNGMTANEQKEALNKFLSADLPKPKQNTMTTAPQQAMAANQAPKVPTPQVGMQTGAQNALAKVANVPQVANRQLQIPTPTPTPQASQLASTVSGQAMPGTQSRVSPERMALISKMDPEMQKLFIGQLSKQMFPDPASEALKIAQAGNVTAKTGVVQEDADTKRMLAQAAIARAKKLAGAKGATDLATKALRYARAMAGSDWDIYTPQQKIDATNDAMDSISGGKPVEPTVKSPVRMKRKDGAIVDVEPDKVDAAAKAGYVKI